MNLQKKKKVREAKSQNWLLFEDEIKDTVRRAKIFKSLPHTPATVYSAL